MRRQHAAIGSAVASVLFALQTGSCRHGGSGANLPATGTRQYGDAMRAFYVGVAALEAGDNVRAQTQLQRASTLAPDEPAVWADLGLLAMRSGQLDAAATDLTKAEKLAPTDARILYLAGMLASRQGKLDEASREFQRAATMDPKNLRAR